MHMNLKQFSEEILGTLPHTLYYYFFFFTFAVWCNCHKVFECIECFQEENKNKWAGLG